MNRLELLIAVRDQIRDHPETHNQWTWGRRNSCGTVACVAGWTVLLGGGDVEWWDSGNEVVPDGPTSDGPSWLHPDEDAAIYRPISVQARELLGLGADEAKWLFHECRSYDEVLDTLGRLIAEEAAR